MQTKANDYVKTRWAELTTSPRFDIRRETPPLFDRRRSSGGHAGPNLKLHGRRIIYVPPND